MLKTTPKFTKPGYGTDMCKVIMKNVIESDAAAMKKFLEDAEKL